MLLWLSCLVPLLSTEVWSCIPTRSPGDGIGGVGTPGGGTGGTGGTGTEETTTAVETTTTAVDTTTTTSTTTTTTTSTTTTTTTTTNPCPSGWVYFDMTNACYYVGSGGLISSWQDAENECIALGTFGSMMGHLTSITSAAENAFLVSIASVGGILDPLMVPWIGLMRAFSLPPFPNTNPFTWSDGEPFTFNMWLLPPLNPSPISPLDCGQLLSDGIVGFPVGQGSWVTFTCASLVSKYICKVPL